MRRHILSILIIATVSFAIYANTLKNGFVYDDEFTIINNALIKEISNFPKLFSKEDYFTLSGEQSYRPVVTLTYFIDYALYGLKPWGFHLTNILLHAINGTLLYLFLTLIIQDPSIKDNQRSALKSLFADKPFLISLIFISHPVLTEAVNAISFREDLLAFLFYTATFIIYLYLRSKSPSSRRAYYLFYAVSCLFYSLALFSKEMSVTLPLVIYCYEWVRKNKKVELIQIIANRHNIGYIALTLVYSYLRFFYFQNPLPEENPGWNLSQRLLTMPWFFLNYLKLIFLPVSLSIDYWIIPVKSVFSSSFIMPFLLLFLTFNLLKNKEFAFGALFFIISLIPVSNIILITNPFAERYLYLPIVGILIVAISAINNLGNSLKKMFFASILIFAIFSIYSLSTIKRNFVWHNDLSLWSYTAKKKPDSGRVHFNLGRTYSKNGQYEEAIKEFQIVLKWNPNDLNLFSNLGYAFHQQGRLYEAIQCYLRAIQLSPNNPRVHSNLGQVYADLNIVDKAFQEYQTALRLNPRDPSIHFSIGVLYYQQGQLNIARQAFLKASQLNPGFIQAEQYLTIIDRKD